MKRRLEWLRRARDELGVRIEFDYIPLVPGAPVLTPIAWLPDFGAPKGMLIFFDYDDVRDISDALLDAGYGFSVLGEPAPTQKFDRQVFKKVLMDWCWSGDPKHKPSWMSP